MEASGGLSPETQIAHSRTGLSRSARSERPHRCERGYTGSEDETDASSARHAAAKRRQSLRQGAGARSIEPVERMGSPALGAQPLLRLVGWMGRSLYLGRSLYCMGSPLRALPLLR